MACCCKKKAPGKGKLNKSKSKSKTVKKGKAGDLKTRTKKSQSAKLNQSIPKGKSIKPLGSKRQKKSEKSVKTQSSKSVSQKKLDPKTAASLSTTTALPIAPGGVPPGGALDAPKPTFQNDAKLLAPPGGKQVEALQTGQKPPMESEGRSFIHIQVPPGNSPPKEGEQTKVDNKNILMSAEQPISERDSNTESRVGLQSKTREPSLFLNNVRSDPGHPQQQLVVSSYVRNGRLIKTWNYSDNFEVGKKAPTLGELILKKKGISCSAMEPSHNGPSNGIVSQSSTMSTNDTMKMTGCQRSKCGRVRSRGGREAESQTATEPPVDYSRMEIAQALADGTRSLLKMKEKIDTIKKIHPTDRNYEKEEEAVNEMMKKIKAMSIDIEGEIRRK